MTAPPAGAGRAPTSVRILSGRHMFRVGQPLVVLEARPDGDSIVVRIGIMIFGESPRCDSRESRYDLGSATDPKAVAIALNLAETEATTLIQHRYIDRNPEPNGKLPPPDLTPTDHTALRGAWTNPGWRPTLEKCLVQFADRFLADYLRLLRGAAP